MFDYHVHTTQSADCATPMFESCEAAIRAGVSEIAFTDHIEHEPADMSYGFFDYSTYMRDMEIARERFGDRLVILAGAEVDFNRRIMPEVEEFLGRHEFDFVIGSVHYGEDAEIIFPEYFRARSITDVMRAYLEEIQAGAETGWFDSMGHIDLPKRYRPPAAGAYDPMACRSALVHLLQSIVDREMSFEINTSGLRQAPRTSMPGPQVVDLYVKLGGTLITMGSDSHVPDTIGSGFERTMHMLELCGIQGISSFRKRQRTTVPLRSLLRS